MTTIREWLSSEELARQRAQVERMQGALLALRSIRQDGQRDLLGSLRATRGGSYWARLLRYQHSLSPRCAMCGCETRLDSGRRDADGAALYSLIPHAIAAVDDTDVQAGFTDGNLALMCRACCDAVNTYSDLAGPTVITPDMLMCPASVIVALPSPGALPSLARTSAEPHAHKARGRRSHLGLPF